jgi:hypothetical protein
MKSRWARFYEAWSYAWSAFCLVVSFIGLRLMFPKVPALLVLLGFGVFIFVVCLVGLTIFGRR